MIRLSNPAYHRPGDIGFYWGTRVISDLVRVGERLAGEGEDPPTHVFICSSTGGIFEAVYPHIRASAWGKYPSARLAIYALPRAASMSALKDFEEQWQGRGYGVTQLLGMALVEPLRAMGFEPRWNWLERRRTAFCSQLADYWLRRCGLRDEMAPALTDPANLLAFVGGCPEGPDKAA